MKKIEKYDMNLSVADNEKNIKAKYEKINSAKGVSKYVVDKVTGRNSAMDSFLVIDPNPICTTQWEQVEVYKAWDGNWYLKDTPAPSCPKDMYGDKCHIKCESEIGCTTNDTPEQIIAKKKTYRKKKCDEQIDAKYCEYNEYNPNGIRTSRFQERNKLFVNQSNNYNASVANTESTHKGRMFALDAEIQKEEEYKIKLANDYTQELSELEGRIISITNQIDSTNSQIGLLTKELIEKRGTKISFDVEKTIVDIIANAKKIDEDNSRLEREINMLNQRVENSNQIKDALQNQYNTLKGLPSKISITKSSATSKPVANNASLPAPPTIRPTSSTGAPKATEKKQSFCPIL
jgi:hypothetical protein